MFLCFVAGRKVCIKPLIGMHIQFNFSCGFYAVHRSVKIDCQAEDTGAADCWCYIFNQPQLSQKMLYLLQTTVYCFMRKLKAQLDEDLVFLD